MMTKTWNKECATRHHDLHTWLSVTFTHDSLWPSHRACCGIDTRIIVEPPHMTRCDLHQQLGLTCTHDSLWHSHTTHCDLYTWLIWLRTLRRVPEFRGLLSTSRHCMVIFGGTGSGTLIWRENIDRREGTDQIFHKISWPVL